MAKSVKDLPANIQEYIELFEWDMRTLEGNAAYKRLKANSLPSIALDNELVYESIIPGQDDLAAEITRRWRAKNP